MRIVTLRRRHNFRFQKLLGNYSESLQTLLELLIAVLQVVASFGFYLSKFDCCYKNACYLFIAISVVNMVLSAQAIDEARTTEKKGKLDEGSLKEISNVKVQLEEQQLEATLYLVGNLFFAIASILYLPGVYSGSASRTADDLNIGTTLYLVGSCLFASAALINALGMNVNGKLKGQTWEVSIAIFSLHMTTWGCYTFVAGSIFFYPETAASAAGGPGCTAEVKWASVDIGATLFVVGSCFFLLATVANLGFSFVKAHAETLTAGLAKVEGSVKAVKSAALAQVQVKKDDSAAGVSSS